MAVGVVGADGDQGQAWAQREDQRGVLSGRAVVGDLEHVDAGPGQAGAQVFLGLGLGVAGEQHAHPVSPRQDDQARVVDGRPPDALAGRVRVGVGR